MVDRNLQVIVIGFKDGLCLPTTPSSQSHRIGLIFKKSHLSRLPKEEFESLPFVKGDLEGFSVVLNRTLTRQYLPAKKP